MTEGYAPQRADTSRVERLSGNRMLEMVAAEYESLPEIRYLDDYIHLCEQLEAMRAMSTPFRPQSFAVELALLFRLNDYDRRIGMPELPMPGEDQ